MEQMFCNQNECDQCVMYTINWHMTFFFYKKKTIVAFFGAFTFWICTTCQPVIHIDHKKFAPKRKIWFTTQATLSKIQEIFSQAFVSNWNGGTNWL